MSQPRGSVHARTEATTLLVVITDDDHVADWAPLPIGTLPGGHAPHAFAICSLRSMARGDHAAPSRCMSLCQWACVAKTARD